MIIAHSSCAAEALAAHILNDLLDDFLGTEPSPKQLADAAQDEVIKFEPITREFLQPAMSEALYAHCG